MKAIVLVHAGTYNFDASAQEVTINGVAGLIIQNIQLIINQTDGVTIYNPLDPNKGGTLSGNTLTLAYDTTSMSDTDELIIHLCLDTVTDVAVVSSVLPTGAATEAKQDSQITELQAIKGFVDGLEGLITTLNSIVAKETKQDSQIALATTLNTYVDGIEGLLTTLNGKDFATQTTLALIKTAIDTINSNINVTLSTRASEATLIQVRDYLDTVETKLQTLIDNSTSANADIADILDELIEINPRATGVIKEVSSASTTSILIGSAFATRKSMRVRNLNTKRMYLTFESPATLTSAIYLDKDEIWLEEECTGECYGIWETGASGNGCSIEHIFRT